MAELSVGTVIKTDFGAPIKVDKLLGEGTQGYVYLVDFAGKKMALKWYKDKAIREPDAFYKNLKNNVQKGAPDKAFLWPEAVTERKDGTFGYVMPVRPDGYYDFKKVINKKEINISSFKAIAEAAIKVTYAFNKLHSIGYSYQDLSAGNFFINLKTGDVLICDNDNAAPNDTHTGIIGTPCYMAPEIVTGDGIVMPNIWTDRYSLAVILFMLFFVSHPLEGRKWLVPCLTDKISRNLYGEDPIFVFDEVDKSNRPVRGIHDNLQNRWPFMPEYIKEAFKKAFSKEALMNPQRRMTEGDWLEILTRFRSDIIICPCGNNILIKDIESAECEICGRKRTIMHSLQLPRYTVPAIKGTRVYRCQLGTCNIEHALDPVAFVLESDEKKTFLKNKTTTTWSAVTPSGKVNQVAPEGAVPFVAGIELKVYEKPIKIIK